MLRHPLRTSDLSAVDLARLGATPVGVGATDRQGARGVFDQAENRLHTSVSLRSALLEGTAGTIVRR